MIGWLRRIAWRKVLLWAMALFVALSGYGVYVGWRLTHLKRMPVATTPAFWGMPYRKVRFPSAVDHLKIRGWFIPAARKTDLTVVFSHGYGENRADIGVPGLLMMRAVHLWGANILTFDYRGEGRSPGHLISVGQFEVRDLLGAVRAVRRRLAPRTKVAIVGYSMGATIALMAGEADPHVAAVVADSPFAALVPYLQRNLPIWTRLPAYPFDWIILALTPPVTGVNPWAVDPLAHLSRFGDRPVLLIAGTKDKTVPDRNAKLLYARLKTTDPNAQIWIVKGAHHVESFQLRPLPYLARLFAVLHSVAPGLRAPKDFGL